MQGGLLARGDVCPPEHLRWERYTTLRIFHGDNPGNSLSFVLYLSLPAEIHEGEMEAAQAPGRSAGLLGACTGTN